MDLARGSDFTRRRRISYCGAIFHPPARVDLVEKQKRLALASLFVFLVEAAGILFCGKATAVAACHRHPAKSRLSIPFAQTPYLNNKRPPSSGGLCYLVEAAGIEPASENPSTSLSPGAEGCQHSLTYQSTVKLICLVASLCMVRSKLCALTDATNPRLYPARGPSGKDGRHYLGSDSNCVVVV